MNIHHRLKKIIEDENISISKFERIIGVGKIQFRHALKESQLLTISYYKVSVRIFYISIEWILTGKDSKNKQIIEKSTAC